MLLRNSMAKVSYNIPINCNLNVEVNIQHEISLKSYFLPIYIILYLLQKILMFDPLNLEVQSE